MDFERAERVLIERGHEHDRRHRIPDGAQHGESVCLGHLLESISHVRAGALRIRRSWN